MFDPIFLLYRIKCQNTFIHRPHQWKTFSTALNNCEHTVPTAKKQESPTSLGSKLVQHQCTYQCRKLQGSNPFFGDLGEPSNPRFDPEKDFKYWNRIRYSQICALLQDLSSLHVSRVLMRTWEVLECSIHCWKWASFEPACLEGRSFVLCPWTQVKVQNRYWKGSSCIATEQSLHYLKRALRINLS